MKMLFNLAWDLGDENKLGQRLTMSEPWTCLGSTSRCLQAKSGGIY